MADKNVVEKALKSFSDTTGGYWADSNAEFEKTNPRFKDRLARSLNPATGIGSAIGSMYTAAGEGSELGMALAAFGAAPGFGVMRAPVSGLAPAGRALLAKALINNRYGIRNVTGMGATDAALDKYPATSGSEWGPLQAMFNDLNGYGS